MNERMPPKLKKFSAAKQQKMDELLDKNSEGTITPAEKEVLEKLVAEAEQLMVANAKRLAAFAASESGPVPPKAAPVTIWVKPEHAEP
jgi:hypothetical protein